MRAQPRVRLGAPLVGHPGRHDRLPGRGRLRDLAHRQIAVDGERERARDRRGGHVEDVRRAPLGERRALLDAEAVLLVDDRDGEVAELEALLDQRVRADDDVRQRRVRRLRRAGHERAGDAELRTDPFDREEVLLGERLRRRHQRALTACLDRAQERVQRDDGLARADVALEQPLHRGRAREIGIELGDRRLLVLRERERKRGAVALDQLARLRQRGRNGLLPLGVLAGERELEDEQLVEGEPLSPLLRLARASAARGARRARRPRSGSSRSTLSEAGRASGSSRA